MMNPEQFKAYAESGGTVCPFCETNSTCAVSDIYVGIGQVPMQNIKCSSCNRTWIDVYKLVNTLGYE
jgi:transposase-like protein